MTQHRKATEHLPLHPLDFRVLLALFNGPSYGTRIVEDIEAREGKRSRIYPANLFRRIRDLLAKGILEESPAPGGADPRRTYIRLTDLGHAVAVAEGGRLRELVAEADHLTLPSGG
jgi:DNA-binding PadR family transcriptional regulator